MSGKTLILAVAVTATSLAFASTRHDRAVQAPRGGAGTIGTATVEVESLRVISYLDEDGNWRAPDSTLVPPVPLRGPREIAIVPGRAPATVAERVEPR